jgi:hypothetical protein
MVGFIVYLPVPTDDSPSGGFGVECISMLTDPSRPRIYCGGSNQELVVFATDTMTILRRIPDTGYIAHMSISADGRTLWCVRTYYYNSLGRVDLDALDGLTAIPASPRLDAVREGLDNRLYATAGVEVLQMDQTGVIQQRFEPNEDYPPTFGLTLAISPDRRTLYLGHPYYVNGSLVTHSALSRYDISSATPALVQRVEMPTHMVQSITAAPDGESLYVVLGTLDGYGSTAVHQVLSLAANDLTVTRGVFSFHGTANNGITISADSTRALVPIALGNGGPLTTGLVGTFDTHSFQTIKMVVLATRSSIFVGEAAFDQTGSSMFVDTDLNPPVRKYPVASLPPPPVTANRSLLNISTRMRTEGGESVLIGGFIVTGSDSKQVMLRAIGPSLPLPGSLANPVLELHGPGGTTITENDNWNSHRAEVLATGIAPLDEYESAIVTTLPPGAYTAILRGFGSSAGVAVVEAYDLDTSTNSRLANISTRGKVEAGDNVMIGGCIVGGYESTKVGIRAIGPSLVNSGVSGPLVDPTLDLYNGNGALLAQNDDWRTSQEQALIDSGLAPTDDRESAMIVSLMPGGYTAIVRGKNDMTGVALVEVYNLQ